MKRKLLFVMALVISAMSLYAQEAGTYYVQNVGNGRWLGPGNSWGTQASTLQHADYWKLAKISDGVYTFESVVSNGGTSYYLSGTFCDGGSTNFTLTSVAGKENVYTIANPNGGLLTALSNGTVDVSGSDANSEASQWKLYSEADMSALLNAATIDNPTDATYLIKDHDLGRNNRDYSAWKNSGATAPKSSAGNAASTVYSVEAYHVAFDVCQELTGVPNGVYGVQVNGFYRQDGSNTDLPYVYANDSQKTLPVRTGTENNMQDAAVSFVAGNYLSDLAYVQVTDGNLKVGVSTKGNSCWAIFKSFHLKYYGDVNLTQVVLKDKIAAFEKALADAKPVASSTDQMTQSFRDALNAAITKYDGKSYDTEEEYDAAINELTTATDKARKNIESYKNAPAYFAKMKAVLDNTNVYTQESYDDYYGTWLAQYEEGTLTEELSESKAYSSGWHSANYIDDILLSTWTIGDKQCKDYTAGMYINTWSVEGNTDGSEFFAPFFEYWVADAQSVAANTMISKVTNLKPNTNYSFTIRARVRQTNGKTKPAEAIMLQVGEGTPVDISAGTQFGSGQFYIGNFSAMGTTDAGGNLTAKITVNADNNISWLSFYNCMVTEGEDLSAFIADYEFALAQVNEELKNEDYADMATDLKTAATTYADVDRTNKAALIEAKEQLTAALNAYNAVVGPLKGTDISKWVTTNNNGTFEVNTWSVEGNADGSNMKTPFTQNWIGRGTALTDATMSYTMEGFAPGYYKVSALIRVLDESGKATPSGVFIFANDNIERAYGDNASACNNGVYGRPTVYGYVGEDGKLTIGVKVINTGVNWVSWKNFTVVAAGNELTAEMANNQKEEKRTFEYNMSAQGLQDDQVATLDAALLKENYIVAGKAIEEAYKTEDLNFVQMWITDAHYATFVAPFDVTIPEGVTAYTVPGLEANGYTLVLKEVKTTITANTPVVLFSEAEVDEEFGGAALGKEPVTEGLLTGVFDFTEITGADKYVLQNQPEVDGVAFYPATDPTNAVLVSPNRAYLYIPETAVVVGAKAIRFPGADATGINTINVLTSGKAEIFNAAGARIPSLQKGVNIIRTADGKTSKVLVK